MARTDTFDEASGWKARVPLRRPRPRRNFNFSCDMIVHFRHKGLREFAQTGSTAGINPQHARKLKIILQLLDGMSRLNDLSQSFLDLHPLKGELQGYWAVRVNRNWRVIFLFDEASGQVFDVDYLDYH